MNLTVTSSPHIRGKDTIQRTMLDVILALLPALAASTIMLGARYLAVAVVSMAAAILAEWIFCWILKKPNTVRDGSAAVTGLLLSLTLPATVPYWMCALGAVFAIVVVKGFFGGLGQNIFNPALAARAFLLLLFPAALVRYAAPGQNLSLLGTVDVIVSATPLHHMQMPTLPDQSILEMLLGNSNSSLNEALLLLGGIYLVWRKVISVRIPAAYLGSLALLTFVFHKGDDPLAWMLYSLLSGGVILGAIFMATDYATSPVTPHGQILYGIGCGILTVVFRYVGLYPEGVTYAILLMNAVVWLLERVTPPVRFGEEKGDAA
ncbi:MAG TPA: RnfABCDGE type electron transport complex subunit D [Candidatus Faecousia intestinigallinarum]|nr:RnfABCDGE type electron transport complex subunit D [Candidatus Faecousia intestinigallinarum]